MTLHPHLLPEAGAGGEAGCGASLTLSSVGMDGGGHEALIFISKKKKAVQIILGYVFRLSYKDS